MSRKNRRNGRYREKRPVRYNARRTLEGVTRFGIMLLALSFTYNNVTPINKSILSGILPIGSILLLGIFVLVIRHIYRVFRWYCVVIEAKPPNMTAYLILHACVYLAVASIALSSPALSYVKYLVTHFLLQTS